MTFHLAISIPATGGPPALVPRLGNSSFLKSSFPNFLQISENRTSGTRSKSMRSSSIRSTGLLDAVISHSIQSTPPNEATYPQMDDEYRSLWNLLFDFPEKSHILSGYLHRVVIADIDPATAKLAIGILGPVLSAFSFLFIVRIVMSWYPKLPVGKFPYVLAYAPTEPLLIPTRKVIPPLGGVDVTPVVWFGLISFLNEILVGPQGLLVLLSQQV